MKKIIALSLTVGLTTFFTPTNINANGCSDPCAWYDRQLGDCGWSGWNCYEPFCQFVNCPE